MDEVLDLELIIMLCLESYLVTLLMSLLPVILEGEYL
jgi:hypothetical protein